MWIISKLSSWETSNHFSISQPFIHLNKLMTHDIALQLNNLTGQAG